MHRNLTWLIGPETLLTTAVWLCYALAARHGSGQGRDVAILEKAVMALPFVIVPAVFVTVFMSGAKNWLWLARFVGVTYVGLGICAFRLIREFGEGAKGQDAGLILVFTFATVLLALGTSAGGAIILGEVRPGFSEWFRERKLTGVLLTLLSAAPIGLALGILLAFGVGFFGAAYSAISR